MTANPSTYPSAEVVVVGYAGGVPVIRFRLGHGEDPVATLARRGWAVTAGTSPGTDIVQARERHTESDPWRIVLGYDVAPGPARGADEASGRPPVRDRGLTESEVAAARRRQRVAAYALCRSDRGVLLTELSDTTNAAGWWTLPGGGLDPDEEVDVGLRREVWEESGQQVTDIRFLGVVSNHWVGVAPNGVVEDYHAVRLIHTAHCPAPDDPVVHDVGGSTSAVAWVPWTQVEHLPVVASFAGLVAAAARHGQG